MLVNFLIVKFVVRKPEKSHDGTIADNCNCLARKDSSSQYKKVKTTRQKLFFPVALVIKL